MIALAILARYWREGIMGSLRVWAVWARVGEILDISSLASIGFLLANLSCRQKQSVSIHDPAGCKGFECIRCEPAAGSLYVEDRDSPATNQAAFRQRAFSAEMDRSPHQHVGYGGEIEAATAALRFHGPSSHRIMWTCGGGDDPERRHVI